MKFEISEREKERESVCVCVCVEIEKERESVKGRQMGVGGKLLAVGSGRRTVGWGWEVKGRLGLESVTTS